MKLLARYIVIYCCVMLWPATAALAQDADEQVGPPAEDVEETVEVKRTDVKGLKHPSLQFLRDHRVFLRAQLDQLSTQVTRVQRKEAEDLDERYLMLQQMSAAIAAARDTVAATHALTPQRTTLNSVTELGELEDELSLMEQILMAQRIRLGLLEEDFLGHQETSLVILVKGLTGRDAPATIELRQDNDVVVVELTPAQRASLAQGGVAQIYHEFVEPRNHTFEVSFSGDAWTTSATVPVAVEAARDRLTFLELDLSQLNRAQSDSGLLTSVWYR